MLGRSFQLHPAACGANGSNVVLDRGAERGKENFGRNVFQNIHRTGRDGMSCLWSPLQLGDPHVPWAPRDRQGRGGCRTPAAAPLHSRDRSRAGGIRCTWRFC